MMEGLAADEVLLEILDLFLLLAALRGNLLLLFVVYAFHSIISYNYYRSKAKESPSDCPS
jgi:hypothetical protein